MISTFLSVYVFLYGNYKVRTHGCAHGTAKAFFHVLDTCRVITLCVEGSLLQRDDLFGAREDAKSAALAKIGFECDSVHTNDLLLFFSIEIGFLTKIIAS